MAAESLAIGAGLPGESVAGVEETRMCVGEQHEVPHHHDDHKTQFDDGRQTHVETEREEPQDTTQPIGQNIQS